MANNKKPGAAGRPQLGYKNLQRTHFSRLEHRVNLFSPCWIESRLPHKYFGHAQTVEDQADVPVQFAQLLGDTADALGLDDADGETAQAGDIFRAVPFANAAAILVIVSIQDVVTAVFDGPTAAVDLQ
jgi:hypothetical protein